MLLVEDDNLLAAELVEALSARGIAITAVSSAEEAIRVIERRPEFRIVITDIMLRDISGLELLRKLSKLGSARRIRSIVLSGYSSVDHILNALRLGVVDFLPKPVVPEEIVDAIRRALEQDSSAAPQVRQLSNSDAAQLLLKARQKRDAIFGTDLFDDPTWHIMLDLYSSTLHGRTVTVSDLCVASGSPATTALRRLGMLADLGLIVRLPDVSDRRRVLVSPSEPGRRAMDRFAEWLRDSVSQEKPA
ncbi:MAG: response regulator [Devosia sp.]|nr:response regulator [Devosia sp.]